MNSKELATNIGKFIKRTRRKARISQQKLSHLTNHSTTYISRIERGETYPNIDTFYKICEVLNISICDLFITNDFSYKLDLEIKERIEAAFEEVPECKKIILVKIIENIAYLLE